MAVDPRDPRYGYGSPVKREIDLGNGFRLTRNLDNAKRKSQRKQTQSAQSVPFQGNADRRSGKNVRGRRGQSRPQRTWDYTDIISEGASRPFRLVLLLFILVAFIFCFRLLFLQVLVAGDYSAHAEESRTINFDIAPHRGTIYDRNGVVLAVSVDATTIYCNPAEVTDAATEAVKLAGVMGGVASDYLPKLTKEKTTFVYLERQADVELAERVRELKLDGIYFIEDSRREYPNGAIGGQVIGICDVDGNGITGLELQYDDVLRGTPGTYSAERGEKGTPIPGGVHEDVAAIDGEDIMVSLDIKLQDSVEKALTKGVEKYEGDVGTSVVMDSSTGDIYAICSYPYLDPTDLEESLIGSDNLTTITQAFEPGSIFKTVSALGILESGAFSPEDAIWCPNSIIADEYEVSDAHDRADVSMTFREVLNKSSNVGISLISDRVGFEWLNSVMERSQLTDQTGVDFPGEAYPTIQADFDYWGKIIAYNISFGQGITTTPLQMTRFYSAIENGGYLVQPHFLIARPQTGEWLEYEKTKIFTNIQAIDTLKDMLRGVVEEGTGKEAAIEGYDVVGKTSTAQIAENGEYSEDRYNLCFTGFIDNSNCDLVCFASVNEVPYEGNVANVFHDIMADAIDQYNVVPN